MAEAPTIAKHVPCGTYNLKTLVDFGALDPKTAVRVSGQTLKIDVGQCQDDLRSYQMKRLMMELNGFSPFDLGEEPKTLEPYEVVDPAQVERLVSFVVDPGLAAKLTEAEVKVPEDKRAVFGDGFSKLVDYNAALRQPVVVKREGMSPELTEVLLYWYGNLKSVMPLSSKEYLARAESGCAISLVWAVGAYIGEQMQAGRTAEEAAPEVARMLREAAETRKAGNWPEWDVSQLSLLADNAKLVFEECGKISQFRDKFRDQISALASLYSGSQWDRQTQIGAFMMKRFLEKRHDTKPHRRFNF